MYLLSEQLKGTVSSYTNEMTNIIDLYNEKEIEGDVVKSCITKVDGNFIINFQYNPNCKIGYINLADGGEIKDIVLKAKLYGIKSDLENKLNIMFKGYVLKNSSGDVI
jgi:hypothetical protein